MRIVSRRVPVSRLTPPGNGDLTYVLDGAVAHKDSMGNVATVSAGEFQIMSAGTGITHSEFNPLPEQALHLYQIWILPGMAKVTPRYAQQRFDAPGSTVDSVPDAEAGSLWVYQDMRLWRWAFEPQEQEQLFPWYKDGIFGYRASAWRGYG